MIRFFIAFFVLSLSVPVAYTQMLNPDKNLFSDEPFFNPEFIRKNKIKSLHTEHFYKPDKEMMYPKGLMIIYEFNADGHLSRQLSRFKIPGGGYDTTYIYYEFDPEGKWITKRTTDNFGFYSLGFKYDKKGNVVEEVYNRELNENQANGNFVLAKQYPIGVEKYEFNYVNPVFYKKRYLNNLSMPFKEVAFALNEQGKVVEETGTFLTTRMLERKTFKYDAEGKLVEKTEYSDVSKEVEFRYEYKYDEKGNLLEIKKFRNTELQVNTEFMLENNGFISAKLALDYAAKMIDVVKFSYLFRF
jgi:hypothetical protein